MGPTLTLASQEIGHIAYLSFIRRGFFKAVNKFHEKSLFLKPNLKISTENLLLFFSKS